MKTENPRPIYLKDYKVPNFLVEDIHLTFELEDHKTIVSSKITFHKNPESNEGNQLFLNGEHMELISVAIDGENLNTEGYEKSEKGLLIKETKDKFLLEITNQIDPANNKALEGLYKSGNIFCTQNEPEGFRRITYYLDRPDVMAKFTTKIIGDKKKYPIMLSNGNPIAKGELDNGKHWIEWEDPFKKPAYLYALVAGDLGLVKDTFTTMSGREIALEIYVDKGNEDKCDHAMESLKKSMKWDEQRYSLEYDLDIYMIVAVDSFNMGAMENKGLNIFNTSCVLAKQETATDNDFLSVEGVIGHEYFHNWTGNRVTCRDWFQLTLKEGLTVFRDQEFSSDMNSRAVKRIEDVGIVRDYQFQEDSGPTAHPIKPDQYIQMNNFYTLTVYDKGAEVIRMIQTFLGVDGFRKGMDKYFELFDGQAVTTEDFIHAMSVANNNFDFTQFKSWYSQAGTPQLTLDWKYSDGEYSLTVTQMTPSTPGQVEKLPLHMPIAIGLVNSKGEDLPLKLKDSSNQNFIERGVLEIRKEKETFVFTGINEEPTLSFNREFSAPIKVKAPYTNDQLLFLMANDNDNFNKYEAAQMYAKELLKKTVIDVQSNNELKVDQRFIEAYGSLLNDKNIDDYFRSLVLTLPTIKTIASEFEVYDFQSVIKAKDFVMTEIAKKLEDTLLENYNSREEKSFDVRPESIGRRSTRNKCLNLLVLTEKEEYFKLAYEQRANATNMTDEIAALNALVDYKNEYKDKAFSEFYKKWKNETLVMQKWLSTQALSHCDDTLDKVKELENDEVFNFEVPNILRSLVGVFGGHNLKQFHRADGKSYEYISERVLKVDKINPDIASRIAKSSFSDFKKLPQNLQKLMKVELDKIIATEKLSDNTYEIVSKILK